MIQQAEAMPLLIEACPSFAGHWREHFEEHGSELLYVAAGSFAQHLFVLHQAKDISCFSAVAAAIERLHIEGSPWVKEFATIGVLEGIQNSWAHGNVDPESFFQLLGPESQRWWQSLNKFWSGKVPYVGAEG